LPVQIEAHRDLQPDPLSHRNSPLTGVLLTNADLDHLLGLFSLREGNPLQVFAPAAVRHTAAQYLGLPAILDTFCGASWREPSAELSPLSQPKAGKPVLVRAIPLPGNPPPFARPVVSGGIHSVAYQFLDPATGGRLLVAPDVARLNRDLEEALRSSDAVLFDGTFWASDELAQIKPGASTAEQMGHVTISDCSLDLLRKLPARHKIYIHINNTNPILSPGSTERAAVDAAGIMVGYDGCEFEL